MLGFVKIFLWAVGNIGVTVLALYNAYTVGAGFFNDDVGVAFFVFVLFVPSRVTTIAIFACAIFAIFVAPWGFLTGPAFGVAWMLASRIDPEFSSDEEVMRSQSQ